MRYKAYFSVKSTHHHGLSSSLVPLKLPLRFSSRSFASPCSSEERVAIILVGEALLPPGFTHGVVPKFVPRA